MNKIMYKIIMILFLPLVPIAALLESIFERRNLIRTVKDNFRAWRYWW
jgi:hypothetical protein